MVQDYGGQWEHVVAKIMGPTTSWGGGTPGQLGNDGPWDDGQTVL